MSNHGLLILVFVLMLGLISILFVEMAPAGEQGFNLNNLFQKVSTEE